MLINSVERDVIGQTMRTKPAEPRCHSLSQGTIPASNFIDLRSTRAVELASSGRAGPCPPAWPCQRMALRQSYEWVPGEDRGPSSAKCFGTLASNVIVSPVEGC